MTRPLNVPLARLCGGGDGLAQDVALVYPDLDAYLPVGGLGLCEPVVYVGPDGVQGHTALAVPLGARYLGAGQTARAGDLDALPAEAERGGDRLLHGAPEGHPALELERDVLGHQLRVHLGLPYLHYVYVDLLTGQVFQLLLELVHLGALLAYDDARPRGVYVHLDPVTRALDVYLADARVVELGLDDLPELQVLVEVFAELLLGEPPGAPGLYDA